MAADALRAGSLLPRADEHVEGACGRCLEPGGCERLRMDLRGRGEGPAPVRQALKRLSQPVDEPALAPAGKCGYVAYGNHGAVDSTDAAFRQSSSCLPAIFGRVARRDAFALLDEPQLTGGRKLGRVGVFRANTGRTHCARPDGLPRPRIVYTRWAPRRIVYTVAGSRFFSPCHLPATLREESQA